MPTPTRRRRFDVKLLSRVTKMCFELLVPAIDEDDARARAYRWVRKKNFDWFVIKITEIKTEKERQSDAFIKALKG